MPLTSLADQPARSALRERLASFHLGVERRWGMMSLGGVMCHLAGAYEMAADSLAVPDRSGPVPRSLLRFFALHVPVRWPRGVATVPELVEGEPRVRPGVFDLDHARLLAAYSRFAGLPAMAGRAHPIFGPLTYWEWMRWGYLHGDHHLRQFGL